MAEIQGIARFKIHDGKLEDWKRLVAEAMETVRSKDSGTLQYDQLRGVRHVSGMTWEQFQESLASRSHARRLSTLAELANVAVFMASDRASRMTGTIVNLSLGKDWMTEEGSDDRSPHRHARGMAGGS
jgi:quinol monooxygenase YgiN